MNENIISSCAVVVLFGAFAGLAVLLSAIHVSSTGPGSHTGFITAVEQEGYIYRNYRVYVKTDLSSSQEDIYCMRETRKDLAEELKQVQVDKRQVTINYDGVRGFGWHLCSSHEIVGVNQ